MITKKTPDNSGEYERLFQEAQLVLSSASGQGVTIDSLHSYFMNIGTLASIAVDENLSPELKKLNPIKFIILPLDEKPLRINANTRTIEIPEEYKHNGVGVVGDHTAEILFFKIDRYFDNVDLANQDIQIEWQNSEMEGIISAWPIDKESEPGYLLFGWVLTKDITSVDGKVKFAVRFSSKDDYDNITYSFSTIPNEILINKGIHLEAIDNIVTNDVVKNMIFNRLMDSAPNINSPEIDPPIFIKDLTAGDKYNINDLDDAETKDDNNYTAYIGATGEGTIYYYLVTNGNEINATPLLNSIYKPATTYNSAQVYYKLNSNNMYEIYDMTEDDLKNDNFSSLGLYEKFVVVNITKAGSYCVKAVNKSGQSQNQSKSNTITFPRPIAPTLVEDQISTFLDNGEAILEPKYDQSSSPNTEDLTYNWSKDGSVLLSSKETDSYRVTKPGRYILQINASLNNEEESSNELTYRVTNKPGDLNITSDRIDNADNSKTLQFTINVDPADINFDSVKVEWVDGDGNKVAEKTILSSDTDFSASYTTKTWGTVANLTIELNGGTHTQTIKFDY